MGKITFILGGARSGKSSYAIQLAKTHGEKVAFIATCQALDREMKQRIETHKQFRPQHWKTFEESLKLDLLLKKISSSFDVFIIDCLTLLISNLLIAGYSDVAIENEISSMLGIIKKSKSRVILVSNEVGLGIVPKHRLARRFRDVAGKANQMVARASSEVIVMFSGLPLTIKGE